jgi:hypothetical protein
VELSFETLDLRNVCESEAKAKRKFGTAVANSLKRRIADLRAAPSVKDLPVGKPNLGSGTYVFELTEGLVLRVIPNHVRDPKLPTGDVNWAKVTHIKISAIEGNQ